MGLLDNALRGPVGRLMTTFGTSVTLRTHAENYDANTGTNNRTPTDATVSALVEDYPARDSLGGSRDAGGIVRGDKRVTFAGNAVATPPTTKMQVLIGTTVYSIVKVDQQLGTDQAVTYTLQVRR